MSETIANQSEESQEIERDVETEALYDSFGMSPQPQAKKDVEFPTMDEPTEPLTMEDEEEPQEETNQTDKRTLKLKFNGEDKEVDEEEARTLAQKGMNYDKVQSKLTEQQKAMDELAQLQGYKDHAELLAKLPELRAQKEQKEQNAHKAMMQELRDEAENAGLDPDQVENYLNNHPVMQEAQRAIAEREASKAERDSQSHQQAIKSQWDEVFSTFTDIEKRDIQFNGTQVVFVGEGVPDWLTPDMISKLESGYKPLDAYKLAHMDKITAQSKKSSQQQLIKQQQLGMRGHVNEQTATPPDEGSLLPVHYGLAEEFGVSLKGIQQQNKLIKNRR